MKKILLTVCTVIFSFHGMQVNGQSLKDLFNKENIMEAVGTVVKEFDVIPENIEGEWSYSGIAVRLTWNCFSMRTSCLTSLRRYLR